MWPAWLDRGSLDALRQAGAQAELEVVDRNVVEHRVGAGQVDVLKDAGGQLLLLRRRGGARAGTALGGNAGAADDGPGHGQAALPLLPKPSCGPGARPASPPATAR